MPTITELYPPLPLAEIGGIAEAFPKMAAPEKKAVITRLVGIHPIFNVDWGKGWRYRRGRKLADGDMPRTVDELIWRKDAPAQLGRANPAGFQILYVADRPDTALAELRVENDAVVVADFVIQDDRSIRVAPVGEIDLIIRTGRGDHSGVVTDALNKCDFQEAQLLAIADAFLAHCLTGHDDYEISSHVASSIFAKNNEISAVCYHSRRRYGAINFAVRTERFWEDWALSSVSYGKARHIAMGHYDYQRTKSVRGIYNDGRLVWDDESDPRGYMPLEPAFTPP